MAACLIGIGGVRAAGVRQVEHKVHLGGSQRDGRRRDPHIAGSCPLAVRLHQGPRIAGIGFQVQHAVGVGIEHRVALDLLKTGQSNHRALTRRNLELALGA